MTPLAQAIVVACIVALSAVLASTLLALKKTALRAESVLQQVEREIRPLASQIESLTAELRDLSRGANEEMKRVSLVVRRAEDISVKVAKLLGVVGGLTRIGQYASVAAGVKRGLGVFVGRLRAKP
jgi:uncharacterized protein YoxC